MMKNVKFILYVFIAFFSLLGTRDADAFLIKKLLAKPGIPTFKITTLPVNIMNSTVVVTTVTTTKSALETVKMVKDLGGVNFENIDEVASKMSNLNVTQDGVKKLNKAAKKITKTKVADIYNEESVSNAIYKLFLVEPSESGAVVNCYRQQRNNFYKDSTAEIFAVIREIDKSVPALIEELNATENLMKNGGGAVGDLKSNTVALDVDYQASEVLDKITRMTEELTALQVQFEMTAAMKDSIQAMTKREADQLKNLQKEKKSSDSKKTSSFWDGNKYVSHSEVAFAQLQEEEDEEFDASVFVTYDTKDAPTPNIKGAFEGHEASLEAVKNIADLKNELFDALTMHNVSSTLLSYKDIFEEYEKMRQLHSKSLSLLSASDQCVINYLGKYYDNPEQIWSGGYLGALVNQADMRKGVSRWLIDRFDVAKSQMVTEVSVENSASATIDSSIDIQNLESGKKSAEKHMNAQKLETSFSESELKDYEGAGRNVELLAWKIGADVSRSVALDQYSDNKWGKVKTPFPLWNDQKKFYDLYIEAKYNNIIDYFNFADLRDVELGVARGINKENGEEADVEYKKQANQQNSKWYTNLQNATSKAKFKALDDDADWYVDVKNKILGMEANQEDLAERKARLKKQTQTKAVIAELADITANERWLNGYKTKMTDVATGEELGKALSIEIEKARKKEETAETKTDDVFGLYDEEILKIMSDKKKELFVINNILTQKNEQLVAVKKTISDLNKTINNEEEAKLEAKESGVSYKSNINAQSLNQRISEQKKVREKLEKEIKENVAKADDVTREYDKKLADKEQELQKKLNLISDSYKESKYTSVNDILNQGLKSSLAKKASAASTMVANLAKANALLTQVRGYAADVVLRTRNNIFDLENDLYFPKSNTLVVKEHGKMIDELKSISFDKFSSFAAGANISSSLLSIASEAINQYLMTKVCPDDACLVADDDYFVGIVSKARDFKAPKEPFLEYLPPVREAFYFDGTNFANLYNEKNYVDAKITCEEMRASGDIVSDVKVVIEYKPDPSRPLMGMQPVQMCKFKKYYVSKTQFLDSEIYLPQVWKRVLTGRSFVERDINLKDFLNQDAKQSSAANVDFLRGGRYPCLLSGATIDVSEDGKYIISTAKFENLPTCQNVSLARKSYYYNIKDIEEDITTSIGNGTSKPRFEGSELGFIFSSSDEGYLFIKNTVKSIFQKLQEIDKKQEEGKEYNPTMQDLIYANSILNVSQFGDFLSSAQQEQDYQKTVEELKISVDEAKETLFSALRQAGFEPQEDLNLANDDDYNLVKKTLHNKKIQIINDVKRKARNYNELLNEVVGERMEEINDLSNALLQDNEEMISLSMSLPTSADLAEQIKSEKVNIKVREAHKKQAQEAFQKELERMTRPYCASY